MKHYTLWLKGHGIIRDYKFPEDIHKGDEFILDGESYVVESRQLHFDLKSEYTAPITLTIIKLQSK